jgi:hypothetical protein
MPENFHAGTKRKLVGTSTQHAQAADSEMSRKIILSTELWYYTWNWTEPTHWSLVIPNTAYIIYWGT